MSINWQIIGLIFFSVFLGFCFSDGHSVALFSAGMTYAFLLAGYDTYLDCKKIKKSSFN